MHGRPRNSAKSHKTKDCISATPWHADSMHVMQGAESSAAMYVDKILSGARPGDPPVEQPTRFETIVDLKTAKALGLTAPQPLLLRADEVIQ
jgi:hypothetical protein